MKLIEFTINEGVLRHFEILGSVKTTENDYGNFFLEFSDIQMFEYKDGARLSFEPTSTTWATGERLTVYDAADDVINRCIRNQTQDFEILYIREDIMEFIAKYRKNIALVYAEREIPYYIINNGSMDVYELKLATEDFLYYNCYDEWIMLRTVSGKLVSDNAFAEMGLYASIDNIKTGEEKKLDFISIEN